MPSIYSSRFSSRSCTAIWNGVLPSSYHPVSVLSKRIILSGYTPRLGHDKKSSLYNGFADWLCVQNRANIFVIVITSILSTFATVLTPILFPKRPSTASLPSSSLSMGTGLRSYSTFHSLLSTLRSMCQTLYNLVPRFYTLFC